MAIKQGKISEVYPERMTARVTYEDRNDVVSMEIPILCNGSGTNYHYWLPDIGEQVIVADIDNGHSEGVILGSFYSHKVPPKENNKDLRKLEFSDGSFCEMDRSTGDFTLYAKGKINITAEDDIKIVGQNIYLNE